MTPIDFQVTRGFHMQTALSSVYPEPEYDSDMPNIPCATEKGTDKHCITIRNHFFDTSDRIRVKGKRKSCLISAPECPAKRQKGVRQYHSSDESKILAHVRKGLSDILRA
ncbi:hypothetical protein DPMN_086528 [Dreissena polymorpha]|uniref:Uncharacterized protein n=1 Tax=Dreissena polymorpha TaxID=45954 RepID=A0A9D4KSH1_DREPO|nr:hypothetical protein DPMN_086528 [Dreissena polymorpha]